MSLTNTASQGLGELDAIADSLGIPIPVRSSEMSLEVRCASGLNRLKLRLHEKSIPSPGVQVLR